MSSRQRPPLPPEIAPLVRAQLASRRLSRRGLLGGAGAFGVGALLAACGTGGSGSGTSAKPAPAQDTSDADRTVNWANWTLYLDYDEATKTYPSLEGFEKKTGITATYDEAIEDNDSYWGKVQGQWRNGQDIGKDVVVFTDYMAGRMIRQGYAQQLDNTVIPLVRQNMLDGLKNVSFDRGRAYSVTWQSGFAGIAWNKAKVKEMRQVSDLWKRPELKGRVEVLSEFRDTVGLIMMEQGVDISGDWTADQFGAALEVLEANLNNGQIRQVKGNSYKEDLISGDALAVIGWSGDIFQLNAEYGDQWEFALPASGGTLWSDNMLIPIGSPRKKNAEILMNYYYEPTVAARVAAYVNYICPVKGAREAIAAIDPELEDQWTIFPTDEVLKNAKVFRALTPADETSYQQQFQRVLGV